MLVDDKQAREKIERLRYEARAWGDPIKSQAADIIESLSAQVAELQTEVERLRLPPDETMSAHPGCVYCMEAGTPIRPGQVCPKCGDRLPTKREYLLYAAEAQVVELKKDAERYLGKFGHIFVTPPYSDEDEFMEQCAVCDLNIRDAIHFRDAAKESGVSP